MEAGNLHTRCKRCANRCRVRLVVDGRNAVVEARKQVPGRITTYEACPNLDNDAGMSVEQLRASRLIEV